MDAGSVFLFLLWSCFAAAHVWVLWELWSGRAFLFVRRKSGLMESIRDNELNEFLRSEEPLFYWIAIGTQVLALSIIWYL